MSSEDASSNQEIARREPSVPYELSPILPEEQAKRGWQVEVNGQTVEEDISQVKITNSRMGIEIKYGQRPEGYDGPVIQEAGGGGSVTIPYMIDGATQQIYIGVVREDRPTMGGEVWNVPRGFLTPGETHEETAIRELAEETGYKALASRMIKLAEGLNPNSTFFDTTNNGDDQEPAGVSIYAVPVSKTDLEVADGPNGEKIYAFPETIRQSVSGDKVAERILGSRFIPLSEAINSKDMFTSAAAGHLLEAFYNERLEFKTDA